MTLADRLDAEVTQRRVALLYHDGRAWRLEARSGAERLRWVSTDAAPPAPDAVEAPSFERLLDRIVAALGARAIHVESLAGLPLRSLEKSAGRLKVFLATHDFALFCPRPNLLEEPAGEFCRFSTDAERCARCLSASYPVDAAFQTRRRDLAGRLAARAAAVVHPSAYARREISRHFSGLAPELQFVVPPAVRARAGAERLPSWPPRRLAFVGQAFRHKGILEFEAIVTEHRARGTELAFAVAGSGDPEVLARLRRLGVERLGAYPPGELPRWLGRHRIDLALLLSRFPETHSLALDECLNAGVPVLAAPVGALPERIAASGAGWLAGPGPLVPALLGRLEELRADERAYSRLRPGRPSTPEEAAAAHLAIYGRLGISESTAGRP